MPRSSAAPCAPWICPQRAATRCLGVRQHRRVVHPQCSSKLEKDHPRGRPGALCRQGQRPQRRQAVRSERSAQQRRQREHRCDPEDRHRAELSSRWSTSRSATSSPRPARCGRSADAAEDARRHAVFRRACSFLSPSAPALSSNSAAGRSAPSAATCWRAISCRSPASTSRRSS